MIWTPDRNVQQGQLVAEFYGAAGEVPCERHAIMAGGLPGARTLASVRAGGTDLARYLVVSVDAVLLRMAARGLIPAVAGLSPLEAADLAHAARSGPCWSAGCPRRRRTGWPPPRQARGPAGRCPGW
jgi:hypothetical protein